MTTHYEIPDTVLYGPYGDVATRVRDLVVPGFGTGGGIAYTRPGEWVIRCGPDPSHNLGRIYLQVGHARPDAISGLPGWGYGGKAYLSQHMTDSELVQTVFGLFKSYEEHECRESFLWDGAQIFGPHIDVKALHHIAWQTDARQAVTS